LQTEVVRFASESDFPSPQIERGLEPLARTFDDFANLIKKDRVEQARSSMMRGLEPQ
jgi:hypothetical protein